jgi:glycosyltransferase involved in cell wall biosynthesis
LRGFARSLAPHLTICVSESVRSGLCVQYAFPHRKTAVVHNGADTAKYLPDSARYFALRSELGLSDDTLIFGTACRLSEEKGLDLGLKCFERLVAQFPERRLAWVIVGDGPLREQLHSLVASKDLGNHVLLLGFRSDTTRLYRGFDYFLLPSRREGLPLSLIEAMASGCGPIVTNVDGIPEVLSNTKAGWMVPPDDPEALFKAMQDAVNQSPEQKSEMSQDARSIACERFNQRDLFAAQAELILGLGSSRGFAHSHHPGDLTLTRKT